VPKRAPGYLRSSSTNRAAISLAGFLAQSRPPGAS
jgi:hypothetical protein